MFTYKNLLVVNMILNFLNLLLLLFNFNTGRIKANLRFINILIFGIIRKTFAIIIWSNWNVLIIIRVIFLNFPETVVII